MEHRGKQDKMRYENGMEQDNKLGSLRTHSKEQKKKPRPLSRTFSSTHPFSSMSCALLLILSNAKQDLTLIPYVPVKRIKRVLQKCPRAVPILRLEKSNNLRRAHLSREFMIADTDAVRVYSESD